MERKLSEKAFQKIVRDHYKKYRRELPWRDIADAYRILVSEIMLQQTQVDRVLPKYQAWLRQFPTLKKLALTSQAEVLQAWQGLGYNRRALNLQKAAKICFANFRGKLPSSYGELLALPGVGPYTASAILVFAYHEPQVLIETNIRSAFIHYFFADAEKVSDKQLLPLIEKTLDRKKPREWYYALMDYGSWLKKQTPNPSRKSLHHVRQSRFEGSDRELRGKILKLLLETKKIPREKLLRALADSRTESKVKELEKEGFIKSQKNFLLLK